jgi:hypothetical protein
MQTSYCFMRVFTSSVRSMSSAWTATFGLASHVRVFSSASLRRPTRPIADTAGSCARS